MKNIEYCVKELRSLQRKRNDIISELYLQSININHSNVNSYIFFFKRSRLRIILLYFFSKVMQSIY